MRCRETARDLLQDAFVRLMHSERGNVGNLRAFLYRIASNLSIDHARRNQVRGVSDEQALDQLLTDTSPERSAVAGNTLDHLERLIDGLPSPTREVFLTSGPTRKLHLGKRQIELKHGNRWQLALGKRPAGRVIRALSWLGPEQAGAALKSLSSRLSTAEWQAMRAARESAAICEESALATVGLFLALGYWNEWYLSSLYLGSTVEFKPLQYHLYNIINTANALRNSVAGSNVSVTNLPSNSLKMASAILAIGPILLLYPFIQKYFVTGLTVGAVKG